MRRVLVIGDRIPFVEGPIDTVGAALTSALSLTTDVEFLKLPCSGRAGASLEERVARCALDVWNVDRLIALSFPACLIPHPQKIIWLIDDECIPSGDSQGLDAALRTAKRVYTKDAQARKELFSATRRASRVLSFPGNSTAWRRAASELLR